MKNIGQRFMEIRKNLGVTQKDFADQLGVSLGAVQGYEYGKIPKGEVLATLLELGYDLNWLLGGLGTMKRSEMHSAVLDRMLIWNVAYFLCKRSDSKEDPEVYADTFMEIFDAMAKTQDGSSSSGDGGRAGIPDNVIDFIQRRSSAT